MFKNIDELIYEFNKNKSVKFRIKVSANASSDSIEFCEETIKVRIKARAIEGKANKAIIEYLSEILGIAKSKIKIVNGEKSSIKTILIQ